MPRRHRGRILAVTALAAVALAGTACGDGDEQGSGADSSADVRQELIGKEGPELAWRDIKPSDHGNAVDIVIGSVQCRLPVQGVRVVERADTVEVTLYGRQVPPDRGCPDVLEYECVSIRLDRALDGRKILDGAESRTDAAPRRNVSAASYMGCRPLPG